MDYSSTTNGGELRDSLFHTLNVLTEIETGDYSSQESRQVANRQATEVQLSNQFVSGIKEKMLDPTKLERLQNGQESEVEQLKYNMHRNLEQLKVVIDAQNNDIAELKAYISELQQEFCALKKNQTQQSQQVQQYQMQQQQPVRQEPMMQQQSQPQMNSDVFMNQQSNQQSFGQVAQLQQQVAPAVPVTEPNPRVGNYNSSDVSIEKYFYCGK